jgi:hypothetical protein
MESNMLSHLDHIMDEEGSIETEGLPILYGRSRESPRGAITPFPKDPTYQLHSIGNELPKLAQLMHVQPSMTRDRGQ